MTYGIFTVYSSHGEITVELNTGKVLKVEVYTGCENESINDIEKFNVEEFQQHYNRQIEPDEDIDVLSIGYWSSNHGQYTPPEQDWRNEVQLNQEK